MKSLIVALVSLASALVSFQDEGVLPHKPRSSHWVEGVATETGARRYALLVGVGRYWRHEGWKLPWVEPDLRTLEGTLRDKAAFDYIKKLSDEQVSTSSLSSALTEIRGQLRGTGNVVLVYWVGHGCVDSRGEQRYLLSEADEAGGGSYSGTLGESDLAALFARLRQGGKARVVFVADACRVPTMAPGSRKPQKVDLADAAIYSAERGRFASPRPDQKRSLFGESFEVSIKELASGVHFDLGDLFEAARRKMEQARAQQQPVLEARPEVRRLVLYDRENLSFGVRVIDGVTGAAIKGAEVQVAGRRTESPCVIEGLPAGDYRIEVSREGFFRGFAQIKLDERRSGDVLEVPLYPELEVLEGRVRDAAGKPVGDLACRLEGALGLFVRGWHKTEARTDAQGRYRLFVPSGARPSALLIEGGREPHRVPLDLAKLHPREDVVAGGVLLRTYDLGSVHLPAGSVLRLEELSLGERARFYVQEAEKFVVEGGDLDTAIMYYRAALEGVSDRKTRSTIDERLCAAYRDMLADLLANGRYAEGVARAREALEGYPDDEAFTEARETFERENIPASLRARLDRAAVAVRRGEFEEAWRLYEALSGEASRLTPYYREQVDKNRAAVTEKVFFDALIRLRTCWLAGDKKGAVEVFGDMRRYRPEDTITRGWEKKLIDLLDHEPPEISFLDEKGDFISGSRFSLEAESGRSTLTIRARDDQALSRLTINGKEQRFASGAKEARAKVTLGEGETEVVAEVFDRAGNEKRARLVVEVVRHPVVDGFTYKGKSAQGMDEYTHDRTGQVFVFIPGGTFTMGSPEGESGRGGDEREHRVTLSPYLIGKYEVTQSVWEKVMGSNPSKFKKGGNYPVERVSWNNVKEFCDKVGLELPTEAQWEYACRAGTTGRYAGDLDRMGWYDDNSGGSTHSVGTKSPNPWGLYDMHGNVWEWCQDWYDPDYPRGSVTDPAGPSAGSSRVLRGGSWISSAGYCRSADRFSTYGPSRTYFNLGFRPARSLR